LVTDKHCKSRGEQLAFVCEKTNTTAPYKLTVTRLPDNTWFGEEEGSLFSLDLIKEDNNIIVINYPVLYSGIANIVIFKATDRFYFTEIAYSSVLDEQSYDVESGNVFLVK
jgi:hypothetical protein